MNDVLTRISVLLAQRNIKASEMCADLDIPATTYYTWRKRDGLPNTEYLPLIADYFGVTIDYLLTGRETAQQDFLVQISPEEQILLESVQRLTPGEILYLSKIAAFMESEKNSERNYNEEV